MFNCTLYKYLEATELLDFKFLNYGYPYWANMDTRNWVELFFKLFFLQAIKGL